jgi:hypothetical protein
MENETMKRTEDREERPMRGRSVFTGVLLSLASLSFSCASFAKSHEFLASRQMGVIQSDLLREISGIAASRRNPGVLYVHNDSGEAPKVYAINEKAQLLGVCNVRGANHRDWEDIAVGPGPDPNQPYLYIGDIGDNGAKYPEVIVYRVPEPKVDAVKPFGQMTIGLAEAIRLVYPDGPRDAETLLVDPLTRDIYIISKRDLIPKVYRAAFPQSWHPGLRSEASTPRIKLEQVAVLPFGSFPTGGSVSPDGRRVVVRGMFNIALWERSAGGPLWRAFSGKPASLPVANEPQGEAICFDGKGQGYFTISEGTHAPLHYFAATEPNAPKR